MSGIKITGWLLFIIGVALGYLGLYSSDSLLSFQGAVLHFAEHMQLMWSQMQTLPRVYLGAGIAALVIGLLLLLKPAGRHPRAGEFF
ncbi:MAG TPA: hypothetical protein VJM76_00900 [Gammaproteobacteria bacterium]|nr:hypothetical protein [Gammaproteobacteria bacterium]